MSLAAPRAYSGGHGNYGAKGNGGSLWYVGGRV
jgi:hypothetical protein